MTRMQNFLLHLINAVYFAVFWHLKGANCYGVVRLLYYRVAQHNNQKIGSYSDVASRHTRALRFMCGVPLVVVAAIFLPEKIYVITMAAMIFFVGSFVKEPGDIFAKIQSEQEKLFGLVKAVSPQEHHPVLEEVSLCLIWDQLKVLRRGKVISILASVIPVVVFSSLSVLVFFDKIILSQNTFTQVAAMISVIVLVMRLYSAEICCKAPLRSEFLIEAVEKLVTNKRLFNEIGEPIFDNGARLSDRRRDKLLRQATSFIKGLVEKKKIDIIWPPQITEVVACERPAKKRYWYIVEFIAGSSMGYLVGMYLAYLLGLTS